MKNNIKKTFKPVFYVLAALALLFSIGCPGASGGGETAIDDSASDVKIIPSAVFSTGDLAGIIDRSVNRNRAGNEFLTVDTVGKLLMPLFTGIKLTTENLETTKESDDSFTIKRHFGKYMNRSVLINVKPSSSGTVIKYYQDVDNDTIKDSTDIEIGTATVAYAQANTPSHGSWEFSQSLNNPFGGESFKLDASGDYGPTGFLGSGKFVIATNDYSGNFDVTWTEVGGYKTIRVRDGSIMPKTTMTADYFQVPSLNITIEINSTTNASEVREVTTTEEIDSSGNKVKLERDITTNNDQNGIVTSGSYIIYKTVYNSEGVVTTPRYLLTEGEVDPNATTTTNPNATTTTTIPSNLPAPYAYYSFDGDFKDSSVNGKDLTNNGSVSISNTIYKKGQSATFPGTDNKYYLYNDEFLKPSELTGLTFSGWIRYTSGSSDRGLMSLKVGSTYFQYYLKINSSRNLSGYIDNKEALSSAKIEALTWTHIAAVWNLDYNSNQYSLTLYINGVKDGEKILTTAPSNNSSVLERIFIGSNGYYAMNGNMDEIRIYDTALTADQIKADMALSQQSNP